VEVERVVAGVEDAAREPAVERLPGIVEDAVQRFSQWMASAARAQKPSGSFIERAYTSS